MENFALMNRQVQYKYLPQGNEQGASRLTSQGERSPPFSSHHQHIKEHQLSYPQTPTMKSTTYSLTALAGLLALTHATPLPAVVVAPTDLALRQCGSQWYNPSSYACRAGADSNALCPVVNGEPMEECAGACYTPYRYNCNGTDLSEKPRKASGTFTLTASNPDQDFSGQPIQASGNHYWVGGHAATYCPSNVGSICSSFPNDMTLIGNGYMATVVPGGQSIYWQKDGALAFTQAHSSSQWNLSYYGGGIAYEGGGYFGPNGEDLVTCPVVPPGSNTTAWQLFARLAGVSFSSSCVGVYALVHDQNITAGAWQYT
ncbi:unnamed protein product [Aureobasidium pullulans]|nr:unnamed protein product [Aureobasidium pullulans]